MSVTNVELQKELELPLEDVCWKKTLQALESVRQGKVVDCDRVHEWMKSWGTANELDPPSVGNDA